MIEQIKKILHEDWRKYFPDRPKPAFIRDLLTRGSYGKHARATVLLFADRSVHPFCVVKSPFFEEGVPFIRREHEVLTRLYAANSKNGGLVIPRSTLIEDFNGFPLLLLDALNGSPLRKVMRRDRSNNHLQTGIDWILRMHYMTRVEGPFTQEDYEELVEAPLKFTVNYNEENRPAVDSFRSLALRLERLIGKSVPWVCSHNDLRVANLRIHGNALQVCDWEFAAWPGLPMMDILNFAVDYHAESSGASFAESFSYVFGEENPYSRAVYLHLKQYCAHMKMDEALIPVWIDLFAVQKLYLALWVLFPLQVLDGIDWAKNLQKIMSLRNARKESCEIRSNSRN